MLFVRAAPGTVARLAKQPTLTKCEIYIYVSIYIFKVAAVRRRRALLRPAEVSWRATQARTHPVECRRDDGEGDGTGAVATRAAHHRPGAARRESAAVAAALPSARARQSASPKTPAAAERRRTNSKRQQQPDHPVECRRRSSRRRLSWITFDFSNDACLARPALPSERQAAPGDRVLHPSRQAVLRSGAAEPELQEPIASEACKLVFR